MTRYLFRNRRYRLYFQLRDAFAQSGCSLCTLLLEIDRALCGSFLVSFDAAKQPGVSLKELCAEHKKSLVKIGAENATFLNLLKTAVRESLRTLTHPRRNSVAGWRSWFASSPVGCPLCAQRSSKEKSLCIGLIHFLDDTEFWKGFSGAPLLCMGHLQKCVAFAEDGIGAQRLRDDQNAKLNGLLDELVRFEATGSRSEARAMALDWLCGRDTSTRCALPAEARATGTTASDALNLRVDEPPDDEQLLFENEKLAREVRYLLDRLNELESRGASLQYRVARLSEDNKRLEMGYTGANAQADGLKELVQDLRAQIKALQNRVAESSKATAPGT